LAFAVLLLFSLVMPCDWTQDVPARYGNRHAGLVYSAIYPKITAPPAPVLPQTEPEAAPSRTVPPVLLTTRSCSTIMIFPFRCRKIGANPPLGMAYSLFS